MLPSMGDLHTYKTVIVSTLTSGQRNSPKMAAKLQKTFSSDAP